MAQGEEGCFGMKHDFGGVCEWRDRAVVGGSSFTAPSITVWFCRVVDYRKDLVYDYQRVDT